MPWATAVALGYCLCRKLLALHWANVAFALGCLISTFAFPLGHRLCLKQLLLLPWVMAFALRYCLCPGLLPLYRLCTLLIWHLHWTDTTFALGYYCLCMGSYCLCPGLLHWAWAIVLAIDTFTLGCCLCHGLLISSWAIASATLPCLTCCFPTANDRFTCASALAWAVAFALDFWF